MAFGDVTGSRASRGAQSWRHRHSCHFAGAAPLPSPHSTDRVSGTPAVPIAHSMRFAARSLPPGNALIATSHDDVREEEPDDDQRALQDHDAIDLESPLPRDAGTDGVVMAGGCPPPTLPRLPVDLPARIVGLPLDRRLDAARALDRLLERAMSPPVAGTRRPLPVAGATVRPASPAPPARHPARRRT